MNSRDVFGVVIRTVGLLLVLPGTFCVLYALLAIVGGGPPQIIALLLPGVPALLVGIWFLRGAAWLVAFAYPREA
ncbi:MAG: hypothetical protein ACT4QC_20885 [Planctomycetaceae bacterium]